MSCLRLLGSVSLDPHADVEVVSRTTGLPKGVMLSHRNIVSDVLLITGAVGQWYNWKNDKMLGVSKSSESEPERLYSF